MSSVGFLMLFNVKSIQYLLRYNGFFDADRFRRAESFYRAFIHVLCYNEVFSAMNLNGKIRKKS